MAPQTETLGFVGGMICALNHKFEAGYRAGAMRWRPDVAHHVGYAGVRRKRFAIRCRGKEIALALIGQGADVIFHAAGVTGLGVDRAARDRNV
jgi:basic membrane protein A